MKKQSKKVSKPKPLAVWRTGGSALHISHHRHTGKVLPRTHTSYPVLIMIVLCVGVLLFGMTRAVSAYGTGSDSYVVRASVPGPPPTVAAVITSPETESRFKTSPITVEGTCPLNTYVNLYRNSIFTGTVLCSAEGTFSIETDLFPGMNSVVARVFSPTDVPGPVAAAVTHYYDKPDSTPAKNFDDIPAGTPTTPTTPARPAAQPGAVASDGALPTSAVFLTTDFRYKGYYVGQTATWNFTVQGGQAPYAVVIDWGDGTRKLISLAGPGKFSVNHTYKKAGGYKGSYVIKLQASDSAGDQATLQSLAIINERHITAIGTTDGTPFDTEAMGGALAYLWPSYGIVVLMLFSFWLGERREYRYLKSHRRLKHS